MKEIIFADQLFYLLPQRALFWVDQKTLLISDLHLGKEEIFQQNGIATPLGTISELTQRLGHIVNHYPVKTIRILGDLVHGLDSLKTQSWKDWLQWSQTVCVKWEWLSGNHDRTSQKKMDSFQATQIENPHLENNIYFCHSDQDVENGFRICGHYHPVVQLSQGPRKIRVPCFVHTIQSLILPAFSHFTGGYSFDLNSQHQLHVIANEKVISI